MRYLIIILTVIVLSCTSGQESTLAELTAKDIQWKSIFGHSVKDSSQIYCLLGLGFFRTPRSDNSDSLITDWIAKHPDAQVKPISTSGPTMTDNPNSKMTYCWLVDYDENLNIYLIENGCFPGGTMERPQTWDEMSKKEKDIYEGIDKPNIIVHIDTKEYNDFIKRIKVAETYAQDNMLGIWQEKE